MIKSLRVRWRVLLMSIIAAFALLLAAGAALGVVGGSDVPQGGLAFVARIAMGSSERACTGVLVDPRAVLTTSSCFTEAGALHNGVPLAPTSVTVGGSSSTVTSVVVHPQRDLALARLKTPIVSVSSVALSGSAPAAGDELVLAGFGRTASDWNAGKLRSAKFKVDAPQASSFDVVATGSDTVGLCKGDGKVDVVINNRKGPCKPPNGCQALVPTILKPGQEMHVWYPNAVDPVVLKGRSTVP